MLHRGLLGVPVPVPLFAAQPPPSKPWQAEHYGASTDFLAIHVADLDETPGFSLTLFLLVFGVSIRKYKINLSLHYFAFQKKVNFYFQKSQSTC